MRKYLFLSVALVLCFASIGMAAPPAKPKATPKPAAPAKGGKTAAPAKGGKLLSKNFEEPKCPAFKPAANLKGEWISKIAAWHIPMASAYTYHTWVERLTNKSAGKDEISNLCLKFLFLASDKPNAPYMVVAGGLMKAVFYKCTAKGPHQQLCEGVAGSPGYKPGVEAEETIIATDNDKWALMGRCIHKNLKAWYVMTPTAEPLTAAAKKEILEITKGLGFNAKYGSLISYDKCPKPTVPQQ